MKPSLDPERYDACEEFNDWLDEQYIEQYGELDIFGFQPQPSQVLFTLSLDTYQAVFDDFLRQRDEATKETVIQKFPLPIAHYFYRFEYGYESELQRLYFLRDTWEAIVDIVHAFAIAECRLRQVRLGEPLTFRDLFSDSVAQRLLNVERVFKMCKDQNVDLDVARLVPESTLQDMRNLNQSRNAFSHSAAQSETQASKWIAECYADVVNVLADLEGLADLTIVRYIGQTDGFTLRCEMFRGHSLGKTINPIRLTTDQIKVSQKHLLRDKILIVSSEGACGASPLLHFREDSSGHLTRLCVFRKTHSEGVSRRVQFEEVGVSERWDADRTLFQSDIDELRALFGLAPESAAK